MIKDFIKKNNIKFLENVSLKKFNTYKLDVMCNYIIYPDSYEKLGMIIKYLNENNIKYMFLGNGSNVIFKCHKYEGVIIKLDEFDKIQIDGTKVTVGAGVSLLKLTMETINNSLSGLEFANAIPGLVGASVAMNAGAYNEAMSDVVEKVLVLTNDYEFKTLNKDELCFSYRDSIFKHNKNFIVLEVTFNLKYGNTNEMKNIIKKRIIKRKEMQPLEYPSAGSVFRNPENNYAGKLIEDSNLKGYAIGGAKISDKHANFIINNGSATGEDIVSLINYIQNIVKEKYNVDLILEQIIIN